MVVSNSPVRSKTAATITVALLTVKANWLPVPTTWDHAPEPSFTAIQIGTSSQKSHV